MMLLIAAPAIALRLGSSDASNDPASQTTHRAYELLAQGFGEGFNGPLLVVAKIPTARRTAARAPMSQASRGRRRRPRASWRSPRRGLNPAGDVATITVYPRSSPQAYATTQLVMHLRNDVIPPLAAQHGHEGLRRRRDRRRRRLRHDARHKLPLFIGVVVLLSALLLMIVFRSLVIPLQAAVDEPAEHRRRARRDRGDLPVGLAGGLIGVQQGPIESFIPVMLFAIVFGLSMDYEVFLISRMHERWTQTRDTRAPSRRASR